MRGLIQFGVEVADQAELEAAADRAVAALEIPCFARSAGVTDETFTVVGTIRGRPDEVWREVIYAPDATAAQERAQAADERRVVVAVLRGEQAPERVGEATTDSEPTDWSEWE